MVFLGVAPHDKPFHEDNPEELAQLEQRAVRVCFFLLCVLPGILLLLVVLAVLAVS